MWRVDVRACAWRVDVGACAWRAYVHTEALLVDVDADRASWYI